MVGNIDFNVHEQFAQHSAEVEKWSKDFQVPISKAGFVPFDKVIDVAPKYPAMTQLMQTHQRTMWAGALAPEGFSSQRPNSRLTAISVGSSEMLDNVIDQINQVEQQHGISAPANIGQDDLSIDFDPDAIDIPQSAQTLSPGQRIANVARAVRDTNDAIEYIYSRIKQFLQG